MKVLSNFPAGKLCQNLLVLLVNPCEHRATIVAQAYFKSSKKGKKRDRRIFSFKHILRNFDSVSKKYLNFFFECLVPVLREVDLLGCFAYVSLPEKFFGTRHKIQMKD